MEFEIRAKGHKEVIGNHPTTIEITKDDYLTGAGSCIIAINADKACSDIPEKLKEELRKEKKFVVTLTVGEFEDKIAGYGHPNLKLENTHDIVLRKSNFTEDERTLLINCNKASRDLKPGLIEKLKDPNQELLFRLEMQSESK